MSQENATIEGVREALCRVRDAMDISVAHLDAVGHSAHGLINSLPDDLIAQFAHSIGNSNVAVIKHWRDQLKALL